jgi:hypothetical protein
MAQHQVPVIGSNYGANEKETYRSSQQAVMLPQQSEMETSANVWELDGTERSRPRPVVSELESPVSGTNGWSGQKREHREEHSELHF